jgi:hypothetical protein
MHRLAAAGGAWLALLSGSHAAAGAEAPPAADDFVRCVERNVPEPDHVRGVRITARDRAGLKRVIVLKLHGRRAPDGSRQLLVRFSNPEDIRGVSLLVLERGSQSEVYLASPELPDPRKITAADRSASILGTDLSYEDLEWLQGMRTPRDPRRLADEKVGARDSYVVEASLADSTYARVVAHIDKQSCLPLQLRFFDQDRRLRKEVTADPAFLQQHGDTWVAHAMLIRDARDGTSTHFMVDTHEQDALLPDDLFDVDALRRSVEAAPR